MKEVGRVELEMQSPLNLTAFVSNETAAIQ